MTTMQEVMETFPEQMELIRQLALLVAESNLKPDIAALAVLAVLARTLAQIPADHERGLAIKAAEVALAQSVEQYVGHTGRMR